MRETAIIDELRNIIAGISFRVFLWAVNRTAEQYWGEIFMQERAFRENKEINT